MSPIGGWRRGYLVAPAWEDLISARFDLGRVLRLFTPVEKPQPPPQAPAAEPAGKPRPQSLKGRNVPAEPARETSTIQARKQSESPPKAKAKVQTRTAAKDTSKAASKAATPTPTEEASVPNVSAMEVRPHDNGWMLQIPGVDEPAWVVSTKAKAVSAAKDAARFHGAELSVFTRAGKLQKQIPA